MRIGFNWRKALFLHAAHDRLANRPRGPHNKLRILHAWAEGAGRASSIFDVSRWSSSSLHFVSLLMLGELPVNRTRAHFTRRTHLRNFAHLNFVSALVCTVS